MILVPPNLSSFSQPILSEVMLDNLVADGIVPMGMSPESFLDVMVRVLFNFLTHALLCPHLKKPTFFLPTILFVTLHISITESF